MNREEYLLKRINNLNSIFKDEKLNNFFNQIFAQKIGATFIKKYNESYLWSNSLFLSTRGALVLDSNFEIASRALKISGEIYENLSIISENYDKDFARILSALSYDIAGYQANAKCLVDYFFKDGFLPYSLREELPNELLNLENKALECLILFLHKNIYFLNEIVQQEVKKIHNGGLGYSYGFPEFFQALEKWCQIILLGNNEYESCKFFLEESYFEFLKNGNVLFSQIVYLMLARFKQFCKRNIWQIARENIKLPNTIWENYLKLLSSNIYENNRIIEKRNRSSIFEYWESQLAAFKKNVLNSNESFVLQMPTSAGKTLIAETVILDHLISHPGTKCIYIAPFRALATEIEEALKNRLGKLGFVISSVTGSYEIDESQEFWINEANVLVSTPEKIDLLMRIRPEFFENVSLIVIDEGHIIGNIDERSARLEFLILRLKRRLRATGIRFIFISAVMPEVNVKQFAFWLSNNEENFIKSPDRDGGEWQPTRRLIGKFIWSGNNGFISFPKRNILTINDNQMEDPFVPNLINVSKYKDFTPKLKLEKEVLFPDKTKKTETAVELAYKFVEDGPVLIFCSIPNWAIAIGNAFLRMLQLRENDPAYICPEYFRANEEKESYLTSEKWLGSENTITKCLRRGVGIHFGRLADPIRKSIEKDYREKRLRVLISTNTIAQGINFPIKTVIIHSVIRYPESVSVRDFWNIVGRSGRAGKETEGQIIFLVFNDRDRQDFIKYVNRSNIENVQSILLLLLKARLSEEQFDNFLRDCIEPSVLEIALEEIIDTPDEAKIEEIIGDSLCKVQAADLDTSVLTRGIMKIVKRFSEEVPDVNLRKIYSKTGLHLKACKDISSFIGINIEELKALVDQNDLLGLTKIGILAINGLDEMKPGVDLHFNISEKFDSVWTFIEKWLSGIEIKDLRAEWQNLFNEEERMEIFIEDLLYYRYTWGLSAFLIILVYYLDNIQEYNNFSIEIKSIPTFIKYGLIDISACWAKSIGVNTRESALILSKLYEKEERKNRNFIDYARWFAGLTYDELRVEELSEYELISILNIAQNLNTEKWSVLGEELVSRFDVKGIPFVEDRKQLSLEVDVGDKIELLREYDNKFDIYAVKIICRNQQLGYIPRELSKKISIDMDINNKTYSGKVISKEQKIGYNKISVEVIKN